MNKKYLLISTFILAISSVLYELILAQTLASVVGNAPYRYNLTIGIYIASMGLGALYYDKIPYKGNYSYLLKTELLLSILGVLTPLLVLINDSFLQYLDNQNILEYYSWWSQSQSFLFNNGLIVLLGLLSGIELPLLMNIGKEEQVENTSLFISLDFFGTMVGAALFPLVLFPLLNLFTTTYIVSLINSILCLIIFYHKKDKYYWIYLLWTFVVFLMLLGSNFLNSKIIEVFYDKI